MRGRSTFWLGLSGAVFRPLYQDSLFDITELSLSATLTLGPTFAGGIGMPTLGVRWFAPERGVRLDDIERFTLHGLAPRIALALVQRID